MTTGGSLTGSASVRKLQTVLHAKAKEEPGLALSRPCRQGMAGGLPAGGMGDGPAQRRSGWRGWCDGRGCRGVRSGTLARGTVAGTEGGHLQAESGATGAHPEEAAGEVPSPGHPMPEGPGSADVGDAGV